MDYEQKYNKLLNAVKMLKEKDPSDESIQNWVNENIPELAENEDERIRKAIICYIGYGQHCGVSNIDMIAWLEKQGEQVIDANKMIEQEWSEDDEVKINRIVGFIENLNIPDNDILRKDAAWLKSLKKRLKGE